MKAKQSAGLLLYRMRGARVEVFLVHSGGPFWTNKDLAAWSIPKGEIETGDDALATALREFTEETGFAVPAGEPLPLRPIKQAGGKTVHAWSLQGDVDAEAVRSNTFTLEWPPRSGQLRTFPEVDKAAWFALDDARTKVHTGQVGLIDQLEERLSGS
ncbi:MAG TPA: NUDIX domain-containing protein [Pseudomonadales bacterium]